MLMATKQPCKCLKGWTDNKIGTDWLKLFDKQTSEKAGDEWRLLLERDKFACNHAGEITKDNFLEIYGNAHIAALSAENVKAAFHKTGVHPSDPTVVTPTMLAPSQPKSTQSNLPAAPPTPLRTIAKMIENLSIEDKVTTLATINKSDDEDPPSPSEAQKKCRKEIVDEAA
ncbi:hypothetical protein BDQ17DRAFT_1438700 [Cyathus striatus]|nr:hypothetical protein BDQ17DRAFT_1438700 [Cyathus striatus]